MGIYKVIVKGKEKSNSELKTHVFFVNAESPADATLKMKEKLRNWVFHSILAVNNVENIVEKPLDYWVKKR